MFRFSWIISDNESLGLSSSCKQDRKHTCLQSFAYVFNIYIYIIKITMTFGGVPFQKWLHWQTISSVWQEIEVLEGVEEGYRSTKSKILQVSSCSCRRCLVYCFCFFFCVCVCRFMVGHLDFLGIKRNIYILYIFKYIYIYP